MKNISILGSTGFIGRQALEVIEAFPERFSVKALAGGKNWQLLAGQAKLYKPEVVAISEERHFQDLKKALSGLRIKVLFGDEGIKEVASFPSSNLVLASIVGVAGMLPVIEALKSGKDIALANKEALVVGGKLVNALAEKNKSKIIPVDSEHSAIFQCLKGEKKEDVRRIILTSSGGPFRDWDSKKIKKVKAEDALNHPTWKMGNKITIDSATLMNKGFEVIEAHWLFGLDYSRIDVVIHPQSIIHSLVEFTDGSCLAQLSPPDMRLPIQYALGFPGRLPKIWKALDLVKLGSLTFEEPRRENFPCLDLAYRAGKTGGTALAVVNAANEAAVDLFLKGKIKFTGIAEIIEKSLEAHNTVKNPDIEDLIEADRQTRNRIKKGSKIK
ncbi:MAG: 1-deoxy-D-xylulose-5-phosphate reductoisomerase [Firmicutes bacterium]|nr:1-deoxy-D-xylulose-5-phosphate reductoisomerase [Bacillota bacterium]